MNPVPAFPSVADAMAAVQDGLRFVADADATQMSAQAQAECLQMMERANAIVTAARASVLSAFTSGQGYSADADYSPRAWLIHKTGVTKGAAVAYTRYSEDYVADEAWARAHLLGLWSGPFDPPESWRHLGDDGKPERVREIETSLRADPSGRSIRPP